MANQILTQDLAEKFCQDPTYVENLLYVKQIDSFLLYNEAKGHYTILSENDLEGEIIRFVEYKGKNLSRSLVRDIIFLLKHKVYHKTDELPHHYIALSDQLLNLNTFEFEPFDRKKCVYHHIDCPSSGLQMPVPVFNGFLRSICVDEVGTLDASLIVLLQEMFGYYLLGELKPHAVFFLIGEGGNGKSVLLNVLLHMIGKDFASALSLQTLTTDKFAIPELIGKRLNVCTEEESRYIQSDKFKSLVAGDPVEGERKYGSHFMLYPRTKYIFATNVLPSFDKVDDALRRRMILIYFHRIFKPEEQDKSLFEKLLPELPGILGWAIKGAMRLRGAQNYDFTLTKNNLSTLREFEDNTSSAIMFVRERFVEHDDGFVSNTDLYFDYSAWCEQNGRKRMSNIHFGRDISKVLKLPSVVKRLPEKNNDLYRGRTLMVRKGEL